MKSTPADERALQLFETLAAVEDPRVRLSYLRNEWARGPADGVARVLEAAAIGAAAGVEIYREGLFYLVVALAPSDLEAARRGAAAHAIANELEAARALLVPATRNRDDAGTRPSRPPVLVPGRAVTLGERKSFARTHSKSMLERIANDPHPEVIRILLSNPTVRESDVLRIASKRPAPEAVLREIFVHPRWFVRYPVRLALVQNPNLPTDLGLALVRRLLAQDARTVAAATELPNEIRDAARAELERPPLH